MTAVTLVEAAKALADRDVADDLGLAQPARRLVLALAKQAFGTEPRGPAYPEEPRDLETYLLDRATVPDEDSAHRLLATAGAWIASDSEHAPRLEVVRAIAAYFLGEDAHTAADILQGDRSARGGKP